MSVRVRYAPSPTGSPHVGNIRTALYNFLFSKKHRGVNILRIEDTDRARLVPGCEEEIMESLRYVGVEWQEGVGAGGDKGPYRQSERNEAGIYEPHWRRLLESGAAYWAFDTPEELAEMRAGQERSKAQTGYFGGAWRDASTAAVEQALKEGKPGVVRLRMPRGEKIVVDDVVRGAIDYESDTLDDPVLIKADSMPTYHFAAMVDDHLMGVTHIFRGEEWIASAPKHIVLFRGLGWEPPQMVHLPVIKGKDGSKLSKRHGDTACLDFRRAGYLGEALANFIALIGWSPGDDREVMTLDEMAEAFELRGIQPSSGVFDRDKLDWMNGQHIRSMGPERLAESFTKYAGRSETAAYLEVHAPETGTAVASLSQSGVARSAAALLIERVTTLADLGPGADFLVADPAIEPEAAAKWLTQPHVPAMFTWIVSHVPEPDSPEAWEAVLRAAQAEFGLEKLGPVVHPVRVALTGRTTGPGLFELMSALGTERVSRRLALQTPA